MAMTRDEAAQVHETAAEAYRSGDYQRAGELFSSLLLEPEAMEGSDEIQWNYALCLAHLGDWDLAIQHVEAAGYDEATFRDTCAQTGLTDARHAHEEATALYVAQQWAAAAEAFAAVAEHSDLDPGALPEVNWNIAMSLAHTGDLDGALRYLQASGYSDEQFRAAAQQSGVDFVEHDFRIASDLYSAGSYADAADAFAWMLLDPNVPNDISDEIHWNVAMCQARLGEWDAAFGHVEASHASEEEFRQQLASSGVEVPERD